MRRIYYTLVDKKCGYLSSGIIIEDIKGVRLIFLLLGGNGESHHFLQLIFNVINQITIRDIRILGSALRLVIYFLSFFSGIVYSLSNPEDRSSNASCPTKEFIYSCHSR
jgi:hypothetical protein